MMAFGRSFEFTLTAGKKGKLEGFSPRGNAYSIFHSKVRSYLLFKSRDLRTKDELTPLDDPADCLVNLCLNGVILSFQVN